MLANDMRLFAANNSVMLDLLREAGYEFGPYEYAPFALEQDDLEHRVQLIMPEPEMVPGPEPAPEPIPGPTPEPTPVVTPTTLVYTAGGPATIDEAPVALAAAPAGQVLGAQREEPVAGEAPAVLGASRARGTADETTAPFVRVIVMAAVASAALFLTRKREEEN